MICLKPEPINGDDGDQALSSPSTSNGNRNSSFNLPLNWGSSIQRYLTKSGRVTRRSLSSGDGSFSSSDIRQTKVHKKSNVGDDFESKCQYRNQLEQDVVKLQKQLQEEINFRLALSSAVEHSDSPFPDSPYQLSEKAQELLDCIAILEITVSKLEEESVSLQYQLSQERNERRLAEYHLRHLPNSTTSTFGDFSPHLQELVKSKTINNQWFVADRGTMQWEERSENGDLPPWLDVVEKTKPNSLLESLWHHPNQLSEEMVRCMRDTFIFLADSSKHESSECVPSPSSTQGHLSYSSLTSFLDSPILTSLGRSPPLDVDITPELFLRDNLLDPYKVPGKVDWTRSIGAYSSVVEVTWFSVQKKELEYATIALKRYRMLVEQLTRVIPSSMSCNEKLAFWINIYNALIMHAYLAYGGPTSDVKLFSLVQKASYTVGGLSFRAADIEHIILKIKRPAHRPQIPLGLTIHKSKISEEQKQYSIDQPEPLLTFALSCGMHSSPAVRVFKPENVNDLLKRSLKDYICASVGVSDKGKLLIPKLLHSFAKDSMESPSLLPAWICQFLSPEQASTVTDCLANQKWRLLGARNYSILPFDTRFRFLFLPEDKDRSIVTFK